MSESTQLSQFEDAIKAAIQHAGAIVLLGLQAAERGYTSLVAHGPLVTNGVEVAKAEAAARGVPPEAAAAVTAPQVLLAAQEMGAAGVDPAVVAAETKAAAVPPLTEAHLAEATAPAPEPEAPAHS